MNLLKEAHDHGYEIGETSLGWDIDKSFNEFLKQNNLVNAWNAHLSRSQKVNESAAAQELKAKGYTIRDIAKILGYKHPGSVSHLLNKKQVK